MGRDDCYRCGQAFASVWEAALTLMSSVIAGDSWGNIALPMMSHNPATSIFFCGTFMMINLGLLNLIMAVIVDRAQEARREDEEHVLQEKSKQYNEARSRLLTLCNGLDEDRTGTISMEELRRGTQHSKEFIDLLTLMDIAEDDLEQLFAYMDVDNSGDVSYSEFVRQLYKLKTVDSHTVLILMGERISEIYERLYDRVSSMEQRLSETCNSMTILNYPSRTSASDSVAGQLSGVHMRPSLDSYESTAGRMSLNHEKPHQFEAGVPLTPQENCKLWVERVKTDLERFQHTLLLHADSLEPANSHRTGSQATIAEPFLGDCGTPEPDHLLDESLVHAQASDAEDYGDVAAPLAMTGQSSVASGDIWSHEAKRVFMV